MTTTVAHSDVYSEYPWRVTCDYCDLSQYRSEITLAEEQAKAHEKCGACFGHCDMQCNTCFGHCQQPCNIRWSPCGRHCDRPCDECRGHCSYWCSYCDGHCEYDCDICEGHCEHEDPNCEECHPSPRDSETINDYSYKPEPVFHGDGDLQVGMELEVSWDDIGEGIDWVSDHVVPQPDLWYAKDDTSVESGFEVVTHPMTTQWGLANFPYHALEDGLARGASADDPSCGTHLHLSRAGLTGRQWWTLFGIHRKLPGLCGWVGGRGTSSQWARWEDGERALSRPTTAKLKGYIGLRDEGIYVQRYSPINLLPEQTIELRYPAGDFTPTGVKRNLQWVEALTTFGQGVHCTDLRITEGALLDHINTHYWPELQERVDSYN